MRRFTRLTNGFSKKTEDLGHAIPLHFMYYNCCRRHRTVNITPCQAAGVTDRQWSIEDIVALSATFPGEAHPGERKQATTGQLFTWADGHYRQGIAAEDGPRRLLGCDQHIGISRRCGCDVKGVHSRKAVGFGLGLGLGDQVV